MPMDASTKGPLRTVTMKTSEEVPEYRVQVKARTVVVFGPFTIGNEEPTNEEVASLSLGAFFLPNWPCSYSVT